MAKHLEFGARGENIAKRHLELHGYRILEQNWRYSRAEIDLIAMDKECLVFVEVKTRRSEAFGPPAAAVDQRKETLLRDAASAFMEEKNYVWEFRFDIIGITLQADGSHQLQHYKDAFFPGIH